jgi:dienelactone hydrolase
MFERFSEEHRPGRSFHGKTRRDFEEWKRSCLLEVLATLGEFPKEVPLNPQLLAEWEHDGLIKQKWLIDVQEHLSATLLINRQRGEAERGPAVRGPALLCWHGHTPFGKELVMGNASGPEAQQEIERCNYAYGHRMAQEGYVTFAIDWIGKGERLDSRKPNNNNQDNGRDWCNLYYLHATMLGTTSLAINVRHGMAATNFLCSQPYVDPERIGAMGLSGGGTMTLWSALCDSRIRAAEIICYSGLWPQFGFRDCNYCGMQVAPGLLRLVALHDLQGLLAPTPLLVDIGSNDDCFAVDEAMECFRNVERIYAAAECSDKLELDLFPGGHSWGGNRSIYFFQTHLREAVQN